MPRQHQNIFIIALLLAIGWNAYILHGSLASAYTPLVGDQTRYDYGFINVLSNQTAADIQYWTDTALIEGNYTMNWHQYVNLSIRVSHLIPSGPIIQAYYNFSVNIHSNIVTIFNSTWQTTITLNGSVATPAPTGVSSGLVDYSANQGLPGFFLDDGTLSTISIGSNVMIGGSFWQTVSQITFTLSDSEQLCFHLFNSSTGANQQVDTEYIIDQDTGIYYKANETTVVSIDSVTTTLTYYYQVLTTTVALIPPPSPLPIFILAAIVSIILIALILLLTRTLWLRHKQTSS
jgi:hypothetical protein